MTILNALAKGGVAVVVLKENIRVEGKQDIQTKVMTTPFALFAEVERDLISERTREGLTRVRSAGRKLDGPKGWLGVSRLDGREDTSGASSSWASPRPPPRSSRACRARPCTAS